MPKLLLALFFLGASLAQADECGDIAAQFARDRDSLTIGALDTLMACAGDLMRDKAQGLPSKSVASPSQPLPSQPAIEARPEAAQP